MTNSRKKVGRPINEDKDFSVRVSTTTTPELKKKINQSGYSVSYILQYGARVLLGDEREKELLEIERELATLKPKVSMLESRRDLILAEKKRIEALSLQKENEEIYIHAFSFYRIMFLPVRAADMHQNSTTPVFPAISTDITQIEPVLALFYFSYIQILF